MMTKTDAKVNIEKNNNKEDGGHNTESYHLLNEIQNECQSMIEQLEALQEQEQILKFQNQILVREMSLHGYNGDWLGNIETNANTIIGGTANNNKKEDKNNTTTKSSSHSTKNTPKIKRAERKQKSVLEEIEKDKQTSSSKKSKKNDDDPDHDDDAGKRGISLVLSTKITGAVQQRQRNDGDNVETKIDDNKTLQKEANQDIFDDSTETEDNK